MSHKKQLRTNNFNSQQGFVALIVAILVLVTMLSIGISISTLIISRYKISFNLSKSNQAYFAAESGIEDALLRLVEEDMNWTTSSTLKVGEATSTTQISEILGGARNITSEANLRNIIRRVRAVYQISAEKALFYFGAQVGEGGIVMDDGSTIHGNVFSNGSVQAAANTEITGSAKVAKTGNYIEGAEIGTNAWVDICRNSNITGILTCASSTNCTAVITDLLTDEIATRTMSISEEQIEKWKEDARLGGTTTGDYILSGKQEAFLGPKVIDGNLRVEGGSAKLFLTGTVWVTGSTTVQDSAQIRLDEASYGSFSGILISDNEVVLRDSGKALGTGQPGSYLLIISTTPGEPAITIQNKFEADILYTQNGWIMIQDTADMREVTGYGIHIKNNADVTYEVGLQDTAFSSGPGGSWEVTSWREIE